jgi:hypothetical protein
MTYNQPSDPLSILSEEEVAAIFRIPLTGQKSRWRRFLRNSQIPFKRINNQAKIFRRADVEAYINKDLKVL